MIEKNTLRNILKTAKTSTSVILTPFMTSPSYKQMSVDFINNSNLNSYTDFIIWVDTVSFRVNVFTGKQKNWKLVKSYPCTIGNPLKPTIRGIFYIEDRGPYFGVERGYKCLYYTQIKENYLFHSIIYNLDGSINDERMEMKLSDGCIRLLTPQAKWIYDNIPRNTTTYIT